jgi:hypothetical protein
MRTTARERAVVSLFPKGLSGGPADIVLVLSSPEVLSVVVCGNPNRNHGMAMEVGHTRLTTKLVRVPKNW